MITALTISPCSRIAGGNLLYLPEMDPAFTMAPERENRLDGSMHMDGSEGPFKLRMTQLTLLQARMTL